MSQPPDQRGEVSSHGENMGAMSLDRALMGSLPCIGCGYELQGLSVRGTCPECGILVRATILHRVDPHAEAFMPLPHARLLGWAIAIWALAALVAALAAWLPRISDLFDTVFDADLPVTGSAWLLVALALTVSGVAGAVVAALSRGLSVRRSVLAAIGVALYLPLIAAICTMYTRIDPAAGAPYFKVDPSATRIGLRLAISATAIASLLLIRPVARSLAARSLVLRTGRVDRQTIAATAAAFCVTAAGDLLRLSSIGAGGAVAGVIELAGSLLVVVGSLLVTLAIGGAAIDAWRVKRAIVTPSPSLRQVLEG